MVVTILMLLVGIAAGALVAWLILRERVSANRANLGAALSEIRTKDERISNLQAECSSLNAQVAAAGVRLFEQQKAFEEKLAFREVLGTEFKNVANEILEDKSRRFTEQNQINLGALLKPLGDQISEFKQKV